MTEIRQAAEEIHERDYPSVPFGDFYRGFTAAIQWLREDSTEAVEYGLFLITDYGEHLAFASESREAVDRQEGNLPAVQESVIRRRPVWKGEWSK